MRVTSTVHQDIGVLTLIGEFSADSVLQFRQEIQAIRDQSIRDFILDLSQVTRVDSLGLEAWTTLQRECDEQLALLRLSGPNRKPPQGPRTHSSRQPVQYSRHRGIGDHQLVHQQPFGMGN